MLRTRVSSTALLATLALGTAAVGAARAAEVPGAAHRSHPRINALTEPMRDVGRYPVPHSSPGQQHTSHGASDANTTSTNWSGYGVTGGTFTSVSASWTEPTVSCTTNGIVAFWVGLDGWGSTSVEQDGTGVDCTTGSPQQFAWWETYPANSIQEYDAPVYAGDQLTSTVTAEPGSVYSMVLTDSTQGWTEKNAVSAPTARNASAEIVTEAVSSGTGVTALPDFQPIAFSGSKIDGTSLQAVGAKPIDMTNGVGALIATTSTADPAGDFTVIYDGGFSPLSAPAPKQRHKPKPKHSSQSTPMTDQAASTGDAFGEWGILADLGL